MNTSLGWADVENITRGQIGRMVRTPCPFCSHARRKKRDKCFAVTLKDDSFAVFNCVHCDEHGSVRPDRPLHHVIDLVERRRQRERADRADREDKQQRTASALQIWNDRQPFFGSPAETYLRITRNIGDWLDLFDLDQVLGFHPNCPFGDERLPCMLALVRNIITNEPQAIHRTALKLQSGVNQLTPERIGRMSLGPTKSGAIKLSPNNEVLTGLMIGEGIETTLSASRIFQFRPAWSVISKEGIRGFLVLAGIECMTVAIDNDASGDGQRAAATLVEKMRPAGIDVITHKPSRVKDFNDLLRGSR